MHLYSCFLRFICHVLNRQIIYSEPIQLSYLFSLYTLLKRTYWRKQILRNIHYWKSYAYWYYRCLIVSAEWIMNEPVETVLTSLLFHFWSLKIKWGYGTGIKT